MKKIFDVHTNFTFVLLVFAVGSLGVSSIPYALAMTPGQVSDDVTVGNTATLGVISALAATTIDEASVYTDTTTAIGVDCPLPGAGAGIKYMMRDTTGGAATFTITGSMNQVNLFFGEANTFVPTGPGVGGLSNTPYHWSDESSGDFTSAESTTTVTPLPFTYLWAICGTDDPDFPTTDDGAAIASFDVVLPVAGELLPINTTALILAGIQANAFGFMVALTAIGAGAFGMLYLQVKRK